MAFALDVIITTKVERNLGTEMADFTNKEEANHLIIWNNIKVTQSIQAPKANDPNAIFKERDGKYQIHNKEHEDSTHLIILYQGNHKSLFKRETTVKMW